MARALENVLAHVFDGSHCLNERQANLFAMLCKVEVSPERVQEADAMELDVKESANMSLVELLPELVARTKRLLNCDRSSIFLLTESGQELTTIFAENTPQISIPADSHSIAGESVTRGNIINLERAADHPSFNANIDRQTGYKTRSMLVMPIRSMQSSGGQMMLGGKPIGVVQCINKLGRGVAGKPPVFSHEDESTLGDFCQQLSPIVDKVRVKKRKAQFTQPARNSGLTHRANFPTFTGARQEAEGARQEGAVRLVDRQRREDGAAQHRGDDRDGARPRARNGAVRSRLALPRR